MARRADVGPFLYYRKKYMKKVVKKFFYVVGCVYLYIIKLINTLKHKS